MTKLKLLGAAATALALLAASPASAQWRHHGGGWHGGGWHGGGWHRGWGGAGLGFGLGLATGTALGYGYGPYAGGYAYDDVLYDEKPTVVAGGSSYCAQRYRSYDPASGTYLGYDGRRHPCG